MVEQQTGLGHDLGEAKQYAEENTGVTVGEPQEQARRYLSGQRQGEHRLGVEEIVEALVGEP